MSGGVRQSVAAIAPLTNLPVMSKLRSLIAALSLLSSLGPAFAQAPGPVPALPDSERRTSYSITSSTCACAVNFALYGDGTDFQNWVEVYLNGTRVSYNDTLYGWTITTPSGSFASLARPISNAVLTFNAAQTGTVQIVGARRPRRTSQFSESRGVAARDFNQVLTDITAQNRETWDRTSRALLGPPGETILNMPPSSVRANNVLGFDASGNPVALSPVGTGQVPAPLNALGANVFASATAVPGPLSNAATLAKFYAGSPAAPVTTPVPTVAISRYGSVNTGTEGVQNPALLVEVIGDDVAPVGGGIAQSLGIRAQVQQNGIGDALGIASTVIGNGGGGRFAYGYYANVWAKVGNVAAYGMETHIFNDNGNGPYGTNTTPYFAGAVYFAGGSKLSTAAIYTASNGNQWDVGVAFRAGSIVTASIWDDSSSVTTLRDRGSHTDGIDLSGATFSGSPFKSVGFSVANTGDIVGRHLTLAGASGTALIQADGATTNTALQLFGKGAEGVYLGGNTNQVGLFAYGAPGVVNYIGAYGATSGNAPVILAGGVAADIALSLQAKGNANVLLGNSTASLVISTPTGTTNQIGVTGAATGTAPRVSAIGTVDTNANLELFSQGNSSVVLGTNTRGIGLAATAEASSVNYIVATGHATGNSPYFRAQGPDADISINVIPKGTGHLLVNGIVVPTLSSADTLTNKTLGATTLSGAISGGGNQINNVIIGASTPLAGSFTTLAASTSLTSPLIVGGSGATGTQLTLQTTTGIGTTDALVVKRGNNGGTTALTVNADGTHIGGVLATHPGFQGDLTVARNATTGTVFLGSNGSAYLYFDGAKFQMVGGNVDITAGDLYRGGTKVVGARDTGWAAMTGTANKNTAYDTSTVTLAQLAGRVMSLQAALTTHGLIGP